VSDLDQPILPCSWYEGNAAGKLSYPPMIGGENIISMVIMPSGVVTSEILSSDPSSPSPRSAYNTRDRYPASPGSQALTDLSECYMSFPYVLKRAVACTHPQDRRSCERHLPNRRAGLLCLLLPGPEEEIQQRSLARPYFFRNLYGRLACDSRMNSISFFSLIQCNFPSIDKADRFHHE
jgi:hypothetical protein